MRRRGTRAAHKSRTCDRAVPVCPIRGVPCMSDPRGLLQMSGVVTAGWAALSCLTGRRPPSRASAPPVEESAHTMALTGAVGL